MKKANPRSTTPVRVLTQPQLAASTGGVGVLKGPGGPPDPGPGG